MNPELVELQERATAGVRQLQSRLPRFMVGREGEDLLSGMFLFWQSATPDDLTRLKALMPAAR